MLIIAPLAFAYLTYTYFVYRLRGVGSPAPYREALLCTTLAAGVATLVFTEGLSLFNAVSPLPVFLAWSVLAAGVAALLIRSKLSLRLRLQWPEALEGIGVFASFGLAAIILVTLAIAVFAPPNNWDSMNYHMPRVMRWIENGNVGFFAGNDQRQIWTYPWAEYAILQPQLLWGGDRFANLVQWWAGIMSMVSASLIVLMFDRRWLTQMVGAIACATIPMAILQSTSTQNDLITSSWLLCFIYFLMRGGSETRHAIWYDVAAGLSLGLGGMTKPIVVLYAAPFFLYALWLRRGRASIRAQARVTAVVGILSLLLVLPHVARNVSFFGRPTAGTGDPAYTNAEMSLSVLVSNVLRNTSCHTRTPWESVNQAQVDLVTAIHGYLGVAVDDERHTFLPGSSFQMSVYLQHEDEAGNFLHALLFVIAIACAAWLAFRNPDHRKVCLYGAGLLAGFLLMSLVLRWNIRLTRMHLPLFVAAAPFIAVVFGALFRGRLLGPLCVLLVFGSTPWVFDNTTRQIRGPRSVLTMNRQEAMFNNRTDVWDDYQEIFGKLGDGGCRHIGLFLHSEGWEYPFRTMAAAMKPPARIQIVGVTNPTEIYLPSEFDAPCAVVSNMTPGEIYDAQEIVYRRVWNSDEYALFVR